MQCGLGWIPKGSAQSCWASEEGPDGRPVDSLIAQWYAVSAASDDIALSMTITRKAGRLA